jgi:hypothetical protein
MRALNPSLDLTADEHAALRAYAQLHGRTWKASLREAWMTASEPGILQQLRNTPRFGPRGLNRYRACRCAPDCQQYLPCDCACHEPEIGGL